MAPAAPRPEGKGHVPGLRTIFTDAAGARGWGPALGERFLQGSWSRPAMRESINWEELRVLGESLRARLQRPWRTRTMVRGGRGIVETEIALCCTEVFLHIAGRGNAAADAFSRFTLKASGGDPYPDRKLRARFRTQVAPRRGRVHVDMMARGDGANAWALRTDPRRAPPSKACPRRGDCGCSRA